MLVPHKLGTASTARQDAERRTGADTVSVRVIDHLIVATEPVFRFRKAGLW